MTKEEYIAPRTFHAWWREYSEGRPMTEGDRTWLACYAAWQYHEHVVAKTELTRLRGLVKEACDIADAHVFAPPPLAPPAPTSIDGSVKAFTITLNPAKVYETKARIPAIRAAAGITAEEGGEK